MPSTTTPNTPRTSCCQLFPRARRLLEKRGRELKNRIRHPLGLAVHQQVQRRIDFIDAHSDDHRPRPFRLGAEDGEFSNLSVIALLAPVPQEISVAIRWARLPELVGLLVVALLERRQEAGHRPPFGIIPEAVGEQPAAEERQNEEEDEIFQVRVAGFGWSCIKQGHANLFDRPSSVHYTTAARGLRTARARRDTSQSPAEEKRGRNHHDDGENRKVSEVSPNRRDPRVLQEQAL